MQRTIANLTINTLSRFATRGMVSTDRHRKRLISIIEGLLSRLAGRLIAVVVSLLSVPLTIGYLGPERFGVWTLLGSLLAWLRLTDLGIGNSLTNAITSALASERPDVARDHVSAAFALLSAVSLFLALIIALVWPWIDWNKLIGVKSELAQAELRPAIMASIVIFVLGFPLSVIERTYNASQNGKLANYWNTAGNVASLLALILVTQTHGGLVWLVIAVSGTVLATNALSGIWLFSRYEPALAPRLATVSLDHVKQLLHVGAQFFLIGILSLLVFETDNLVIAHYLGAVQVPSYSLTYNLFGFTYLLQTLLFNYLWVGYTDAITRRDIEWMRRIFALNLAFSLGSTLAAVIPLIFVARPFIKVWAGEAVVPPQELVLWMAAWSMINAFCSPSACLLAAASHLKSQIIYSTVSVIMNITLSIYLVQRWGVTGVIAATVVSYLVFICIPQSLVTSLLLRRLRNDL